MRRLLGKAKMRLMDLPVEILCDIFKRLPVNSICCLRCVSKTLLDIVRSPFFVSQHTRFSILTNAATDQSPRLTLRFVGEHWLESLFINKPSSMALELLDYDDCGDNLTVSDILSTSDKASYWLCFSYCNLLFFTRYYDAACFLIDPFTREVMRLPTIGIRRPKEYNIIIPQYQKKDIIIPQEIYGMGFDSVTSTHKILRLSSTRKSGTVSGRAREAYILELGTNSWREIHVDDDHNLSCLRSICAYGDMHWLTSDPRDKHLLGPSYVRAEILIVSFDFTKEKFYQTPTLELPATPRVCTNLIVLRGSMAVVILHTAFLFRSIDMWVMKDYHKKEWVRCYSINTHETGVDPVLCRFAWCGEWKNGIIVEDSVGENSFIVDFTSNSMRVIKRPIRRHGFSWKGWKILSLTRSLLSLKDFGNLVEATRGSQNSMLDFSKNYAPF